MILQLRGLVTEVFPEHNFQKEVMRKVERIASLPVEGMEASRNSIRAPNKLALHAVNTSECKLLVDRWQSKECLEALMQFGQRKKR